MNDKGGDFTKIPERRYTPGFWLRLLFLCLLVLAGVLIFLPFWGPLFLAAVLTSLLHPVYCRVLYLVGERRRGLASAITSLLFLILIIAPLTWLALTIVSEAGGAVATMASRLENAVGDMSQNEKVQKVLNRNRWLRETTDRLKSVLSRLAGDLKRKAKTFPGQEGPDASGPEAEGQRDGFEARPDAGAPVEPGELDQAPGLSRETVVQVVESMTTVARGILAGAVGLVFKIFLMLFLMYYFLKDGHQILGSIRKSIPVEQEFQEKLINTFQNVTRSMLKGTFLTALAQGTVAGIAYYFLGMQAFFWGAMTGIAALVPVLGTGLVTIPITIVFLLGGHWIKAVILVIVSVIIGMMDNILRPMLVKGELQLHPVWILLAVLGGVNVFGPLGLVLGPLVVVLLRTLWHVLLETDDLEAAEAVQKP